MNKRHAIVWLASAVAILLLVGAGVATNARAGSLGSIVGAASRVRGGDTVIATINGEAVQLRVLETVRAALQATGGAQMSDSAAYRQAMDQIIHNRVLIQEARRRRFTVSEQEARDYLAKVKSEGDSEATRFLQDEAAAAGIDDREFEEKAVAAYREGLLIGKLYEALHKETPGPTQEEIDVYLAQHPGPNAIVLIPVAFQDAAAARTTYAELQSLAAGQSKDQFVTTFDGYARRLGNSGPGEFVHQKFYFLREAELPDYAREALTRPQDSMGLYERGDGTAVVYLVLKTVTMSAQETRAAAERALVEERYMAYALQVEERLKAEAKVEIFKDRLPLAAQAALVNT